MGDSFYLLGRVYRFRSAHPSQELPWSTLVEGGKEWYWPPGKLTLELVLANQKKLLCLRTMQLTKWAGKVPYLLLLKCSMEHHIGISTDNSLDFEGVVSSYFNQIWPTFRSIQGQAI